MKLRRGVKRANKGYFSDQAQFSLLAIVVLFVGWRLIRLNCVRAARPKQRNIKEKEE